MQCNSCREDNKFWDGEEQLDCLLDQLKVVEMIGISGGLSVLGFIKFLLANAPKLETVGIKIANRAESEKAIVFEELLRYKRASPHAQITYMGTFAYTFGQCIVSLCHVKGDTVYDLYTDSILPLLCI